MDGTDGWDPVLLEEYLASADVEVAEDQLLEVRRRVLGLNRLVIDLRRHGYNIDLPDANH